MKDMWHRIRPAYVFVLMQKFLSWASWERQVKSDQKILVLMGRGSCFTLVA